MKATDNKVLTFTPNENCNEVTIMVGDILTTSYNNLDGDFSELTLCIELIRIETVIKLTPSSYLFNDLNKIYMNLLTISPNYDNPTDEDVEKHNAALTILAEVVKKIETGELSI